MSLLLDALQRASKEKEKSAATGAVNKSLNPGASLTESVAAHRFPDLQLEEPEAVQAVVSSRPSADPVLEQEFTQEHLSVAGASPIHLSGPNAIAVDAQPVAEGAPAVSPPPEAPPQIVVQTAPMASDVPPPVSVPSPRIAREILAATSAASAASAAADAAGKGKRRMILVAGGLAVVGVASASFMFGVWDVFFESDSLPVAGLPKAIPPRLASAPAEPIAVVSPMPASSGVIEASRVPVESNSPSKPHPGLAMSGETDQWSGQTKRIAASTSQSEIVAARHRPQDSGAVGKALFVGRPATPGPLEAGYAALADGRFEEAAVAYRLALQSKPEERDALLGLAYLAQRQGRTDEARSLYQRVLRQDPAQPQAQAALLALQADSDVSGTTSRAHAMVEQNPDSAAALSTLGHLLVREGRLADAQQAFFRALALEPEYAPHAYNLAVALDRLHKYDLATRYYERAIQLTAEGSTGMQAAFSRAGVQKRLDDLRARSRAEAAGAP